MIAFNSTFCEEFCQTCWEELEMCQCYSELETWDIVEDPMALPWHQVKSKNKIKKQKDLP